MRVSCESYDTCSVSYMYMIHAVYHARESHDTCVYRVRESHDTYSISCEGVTWYMQYIV